MVLGNPLRRVFYCPGFALNAAHISPSRHGNGRRTRPLDSRSPSPWTAPSPASPIRYAGVRFRWHHCHAGPPTPRFADDRRATRHWYRRVRWPTVHIAAPASPVQWGTVRSQVRRSGGQCRSYAFASQEEYQCPADRVMPTTVWINSIIRSISLSRPSHGTHLRPVKKLYKAGSDQTKSSSWSARRPSIKSVLKLSVTTLFKCFTSSTLPCCLYSPCINPSIQSDKRLALGVKFLL